MATSKLVRDKIPEILRRAGVKHETHVALILEFEQLLGRKLIEEAYEFLNAENSEQMIEELADVQEVIEAIFKFYARHHGVTRRKVEKYRRYKAHKKGRFNKRIVLEN